MPAVICLGMRSMGNLSCDGISTVHDQHRQAKHSLIEEMIVFASKSKYSLHSRPPILLDSADCLSRDTVGRRDSQRNAG